MTTIVWRCINCGVKNSGYTQSNNRSSIEYQSDSVKVFCSECNQKHIYINNNVTIIK